MARQRRGRGAEGREPADPGSVSRCRPDRPQGRQQRRAAGEVGRGRGFGEESLRVYPEDEYYRVKSQRC